MTSGKKIERPAQGLTGQVPVEVPPVRRPSPSAPLTDRILIQPEMPEQITVHGIPGFVIDRSPDFAAANRIYRLGRRAIDNYPTIGAYVASLMSEFQHAQSCSIYRMTQGSDNPVVEHRLTVRRDGEEMMIDESRFPIENRKHPILSAFIDRTPVLVDYETGVRLVFSDLDSESEKGDIYPIEARKGSGAIAIMPFYYRNPELPSGVAVFRGDLRPRGSELEGCPMLYWTASLSMAAAAQIGLQLTHKVDFATQLMKAVDFKADFAEGVEELKKKKISSMYMLVVDLDHFKGVNDTYGHITGNIVLERVADAIRESVRPSDTIRTLREQNKKTVSRWGGEEFGILLKEVGSPVDALAVAERVRVKVSELVVRLNEEETKAVTRNLRTCLAEIGTEGKEAEAQVEALEARLADGVRVTCSIGITCVDREDLMRYLASVPEGQDQSASEAIYKKTFMVTDGVLIQAKVSGRNQCRFEQTRL